MNFIKGKSPTLLNVNVVPADADISIIHFFVTQPTLDQWQLQ
jgi:hypothetical protein